MICRWKDVYNTKSLKMVPMMSTKHIEELVDTGKNHFQTKQNILKPDVIHEYSAIIGGVDNLSRVINPRYSQQHHNVPHDKTSNTSDRSKYRSKCVT